MDRTSMTRKPSNPGEILRVLYMEPLSLTVTDLAERLGISRKTLSAIINGRSAISVDVAMRLARAFNTSPESWLNAQMNLDIWNARQAESSAWKRVVPLEYKAEVQEHTAI